MRPGLVLLTIVSQCLARAQGSQAGVMKGVNKGPNAAGVEGESPVAQAASAESAERELPLFPQKQAALGMADPAGCLQEPFPRAGFTNCILCSLWPRNSLLRAFCLRSRKGYFHLSSLWDHLTLSLDAPQHFCPWGTPLLPSHMCPALLSPSCLNISSCHLMVPFFYVCLTYYV